MKLDLSPQEWDILQSWAQKVIRGGRWGNGRLVLGEEEYILKLIEKRPNTWEISPLELRILSYWLENITLFSPAEKELAKKIQALRENP
ncbi:hypothetical protein [Thermospira aquatica]|uniref:Uncharacterized protein n=1 Tax=Thermospira aquatica TaxID=2828656 RepID=A0AAX3BDW6_9SPIR|nr:hypothetical protein [Thermospira aquatica]URA10436.1 hypothetical protein KDW03_01135 [Thermospira aquatica]